MQAGVRIPPPRKASDWWSVAATTLDEATDDETLTQRLVELSRRLANDPTSLDESLAVLGSGAGTSRLRAVLTLLIGVLYQSRGEEVLQLAASSGDAVIASASVYALLFRSKHIRADPNDPAWFRAFWRGAFLDEILGDLLNPGFCDRLPQPDSVLIGGEGSFEKARASGPDAQSLRIWDGIMPSKGCDEDTQKVLTKVAAEGLSAPARTIALDRLPIIPRNDWIAARILQDDMGSSLLRGLAYEHLNEQNANWPYFENGLKVETDPEVLTYVVVFAPVVVPPESRLHMIALLEQAAARAGTNLGLAERLTAELSLSETREGLDALVRIARLGNTDVIRSEAAFSIAKCDFQSPYKQERVRALMSLLADPDLDVAASAASGLLQGQSTNLLGVPLQRVMDARLVERIRTLASNPQVSDGMRQTLEAQLLSIDGPRPK